MKVLIICGVFPENDETEIICNSKGGVEFSANTLQTRLINGFRKNNIEYNILSAPFIGSYPNRYKKMYYHKHDGNSVSFLNIWGIRNWSRSCALKKAVKKYLENKPDVDMILVYSAHTPFLKAAVYAKKICPKAKICYVVPDLPQYMNLNSDKTAAYDFLKKYDVSKIEKLTEEVDSFVVLTEQMKDALYVGDRPYMVVEGIMDNVEKKAAFTPEDGVKRIVYTGKLNAKFGICNLVDAFMQMQGDNFRLVLCGNGDAVNYIKEKSLVDSRIDFLGQVSPDEARRVVDNASVLVNPRENNEEYTKYSFPSKTLEYLSSGKPVVSYILDGMPSIYREFIYVVENKDQLKQQIEKALWADNREMYNNFLEYAQKNLTSEHIVKSMIKITLG